MNVTHIGFSARALFQGVQERLAAELDEAHRAAADALANRGDVVEIRRAGDASSRPA